MAKLRGLSPKRRKCVAAINKAHGRKVVNCNSGHIVIAEQLVNLGYAAFSGSINKNRAAKIIVGFCEGGFAETIKTPKSKSKKFLQSWEWRTLRYEVLLEFGRRCMCCGATPDDGITVIHVDHIKPRHKYPELSLVQSNLQILCGVCNQGKGAWDETDFRNCIEDEDERLEREFQIELADKATTYQ